MFYLMILIYAVLAVKYRKHYLVLLFLLLQIVSLLSVLVVRLDDYSDNEKTLFNVLFMIIITLPIILPYKNYSYITAIKTLPTKKFNRLSTLLFIIGGFSFIFLLATALIVNLMISDINAFRQEEGMAMDFYYKMLPFDVRYFILAYSLYYFSYFFIPLHFYCQYIGDKKRAIVYLILSTNLILYGLTFFSRWAIVLFVFLYVAHWINYSKLIPQKERNKEIKWMKIVGGALVAFFVFITVTRFGDTTRYEIEEMNPESSITNPTVYSVFDYLGKSNSRGLYALNGYKGNTFGGRLILSETQNFFSIFRIVKPSDFGEYRDKLWTEYRGTFRSYACYTIFDVGYIGALIISLIIILIINRKKTCVISFDKYLISSAFMMVPIYSIFGDYLNVFLFCLVLYGFIKLFLKIA